MWTLENLPHPIPVLFVSVVIFAFAIGPLVRFLLTKKPLSEYVRGGGEPEVEDSESRARRVCASAGVVLGV